MAENNEPATPEPTGYRMPPALSRRNISAERQAQIAADPPDDAMADFVDSVKVLAKHFAGEEPEPAEPERPGRRVKKFQRSGLSDERAPATASRNVGGGAEAPPATAVAAEAPETDKLDPAAFNKNVAWPRLGPANAPEDKVRPGVRPPRKKRKKGLVLAVVQGTGFGLLLLGFWLGRQTAPPPDKEEDPNRAVSARVPLPGDSFRVSERALQATSDALHAAYQGDTEGAEWLFNQVRTEYPTMPGVQYQIARLALRNGDALTADLHLDRSANAGEFLAACCYSQARFAGFKGNYAEVVRQFQTAAHEEPFNGPTFFYWGEALRRQGKPQSAIKALEQALERAHTLTDGAVYLFKQRLAKVESGTDEPFNRELDEHLKQAPVGGDWLLLAAARDILRADFPAATDALKKASTTLPAGLYDLLIKDYLFQSAVNQPTLAALVQRSAIPDSTETGALLFVDPTCASPVLLDPAIWPVAVAP